MPSVRRFKPLLKHCYLLLLLQMRMQLLYLCTSQDSVTTAVIAAVAAVVANVDSDYCVIAGLGSVREN